MTGWCSHDRLVFTGQAGVHRTGWCSAFSLCQTRRHQPSSGLNRDKTRCSPGSNRKEFSNTMQPDFLWWDLLLPVLTPTPNTTGRLPGTSVSGIEQKHHNSVQRTYIVFIIMTDSTPLSTYLGLLHPPPPPPWLPSPCASRLVSPTNTNLKNCLMRHESLGRHYSKTSQLLVSWTKQIVVLFA